MLQFDGALTITHGSGIELPGASNLTTATGDRLICYATAADTVEVMSVETEAAAAGGGSLTLIGTSTASTSASLTVTGLDYSDTASYIIVGDDLHPATDGVEGYIRLGDSSGIDSGASDYKWAAGVTISGGSTGTDTAAPTYDQDSADSQIQLNKPATGGSGNATGEGMSFHFTLHAGRGAEQYPTLGGDYTVMSTNTQSQSGRVIGNRTAAITLDRVQFLFSSGDIVSGRFTVWGLKHA
jgi:hypothetical protein